MPLTHFAPLASVFISSLTAISLSTWAIWRTQRGLSRRGRRQVEQVLQSRGEALVALKAVPLNAMATTTGLSNGVVFQVTARAADGARRTYKWAYETKLFPWQSEGLKRCAHGVWIALA
ncbi:MAG TPA: hypothetical protein VFE18_12570 [Phenylobacterium sp.]|jgi:hypothetical protein|uniref:hypothetical protein n=1 Tax=Phenylobacterium sp. TaxID=1871053 RepID=UPI002D544CDD|nr:hypothetical protein [Phenylobacterium sp.]HZZ68999.1 hypothetical protein [Phenylobacterium sp.]